MFYPLEITHTHIQYTHSYIFHRPASHRVFLATSYFYWHLKEEPSPPHHLKPLLFSLHCCSGSKALWMPSRVSKKFMSPAPVNGKPWKKVKCAFKCLLDGPFLKRLQVPGCSNCSAANSRPLTTKDNLWWQFMDLKGISLFLQTSGLKKKKIGRKKKTLKSSHSSLPKILWLLKTNDEEQENAIKENLKKKTQKSEAEGLINSPSKE